MQDFNARHEAEAAYTADMPVVTDTLSLFKQELDVLFSTDRFDVLGEPDAWPNIEDMLWKTNINTDQIKFRISNAITEYCLMNEFFVWSVKVALVHGHLRDIGVIDITISNIARSTNDKPVQLTYVYK